MKDTLITATRAATKVDNDLAIRSLSLLPHLTPAEHPTLTRHLLELAGILASATYLAEHAAWSHDEQDNEVLRRWLVVPQWHATLASVRGRAEAGFAAERCRREAVIRQALSNAIDVYICFVPL